MDENKQTCGSIDMDKFALNPLNKKKVKRNPITTIPHKNLREEYCRILEKLSTK